MEYLHTCYWVTVECVYSSCLTMNSLTNLLCATKLTRNIELCIYKDPL
jgi:hypothetical protein